MSSKTTQISIVDFGPCHVSVLRARPSSSGLFVTRHAVESWDEALDSDALSHSLRAFAKREAILDDRIVAVVPRHEASVRTLDLPSQSPGEIEGMIRLRAEEILPYPADQLLSAQCILHKAEDGHSSVLAAVARKDLIQERLDILVNAGLDPESMYLSTACLLSATVPFERGPEECTALLEIGAGGAEIMISRSGKVEFGRGIALDLRTNPGGDLVDQIVTEIASETKSSIASFRRASSHPDPVETIHLSIAIGDAPSTRGRLTNETGSRVEAAAELLKTTVRFDGDASDLPVSALGAALCAQGRGAYDVDMLPEEHRRRKAAAHLRARVKRVAALAGVCLLAAAGVFAQAVYQRAAYIAELEVRAERLRPFAGQVRAKREHLRRVERQVERSGSALEMLSVISELAPSEGLNITRFRYEHADGITVQGRATGPRHFDVLLDDIRTVGSVSVPQLINAHEVYRTLGRERNREVWDFSISIPFTPPETGVSNE